MGMMRRAGIVIAGTAILVAGAAAGWYLYNKPPGVTVTSLEQIVPGDVLYYASARGLADKIEEAGRSSFFATIESTLLYERLLLPLREEIEAQYPLLRGLLTVENALAVFPGSGASALVEMVNPSLDAAPRVLFLARVPAGTAAFLKTSLSGVVLSLAKPENTRRLRYRKFPVTSYDIPGKGTTVYYTLLSGVLALANDYELLCRSIDCALDTGAPDGHLANRQDFIRLAAEADHDALFWGYANNKRSYEETLRLQAASLSVSSGAGGLDALDAVANAQPMAALMRVMEGTVFSASYDDARAGFILRSITSFNREDDREGLVDLLVAPEAYEQSALKLVPDTCVFYSLWGQDALRLWKYYNSSLGAFEKLYAQQAGAVTSASMRDVLAQAEAFLGVGIEDDILPRLGTTFGIVVEGFDEADIPSGQSALIPRGFLFCRVQDAEGTLARARLSLHQLVDKVNALQEKGEAAGSLLAYSESTHADTVIAGITAQAPLDFLNPSICAAGKEYLVLALSRLDAEKIIDRYNGAREAQGQEAYSSRAMADAQEVLKFFSGPHGRALQETMIRRSRGEVTEADIVSVLTILGSIKKAEMTVAHHSADTVETVWRFTVEGL